MKIYDKTIIFNLIVTDQETEKIVFSDYFGSIDELNKFLANPTIKEPLIPEISIDICEVVNDSEIVLNFTYELSTLYEMDEDELDELNEGIEEFVKPHDIHLTPHIAKEKEPSKEQIKLPLSAYKYLCPGCWNEIEHCNCLSYPYYLVQIDQGIADVVAMLNLKGYKTSATCEGHLGKESSSLYIAFNEKYDIDLPDGFFWDGWNIRCKYVGNTIAELQNDKSGKIQLIRNCVEKLPSLY